MMTEIIANQKVPLAFWSPRLIAISEDPFPIGSRDLGDVDAYRSSRHVCLE
jgi:hypothetical protein